MTSTRGERRGDDNNVVDPIITRDLQEVAPEIKEKNNIDTPAKASGWGNAKNNIKRGMGAKRVYKTDIPLNSDVYQKDTWEKIKADYFLGKKYFFDNQHKILMIVDIVYPEVIVQKMVVSKIAQSIQEEHDLITYSKGYLYQNVYSAARYDDKKLSSYRMAVDYDAMEGVWHEEDKGNSYHEIPKEQFDKILDSFLDDFVFTSDRNIWLLDRLPPFNPVSIGQFDKVTQELVRRTPYWDRTPYSFEGTLCRDGAIRACSTGERKSKITDALLAIFRQDPPRVKRNAQASIFGQPVQTKIRFETLISE